MAFISLSSRILESDSAGDKVALPILYGAGVNTNLNDTSLVVVPVVVEKSSVEKKDSASSLCYNNLGTEQAES